MLALRAICPTQLTDDVVALLLDAPGVTNVVRLPGAALQPAGDVLLADVAREAASELLADIRALPRGDACAIALETIDTPLSTGAREAERAAPGLGVDAVVWEEVQARTREDALLSGAFLALLVVATLIAAVGLLVDSAVLVIGAMVVGPEFGPIAGLTVALVARRWRAARRSLQALAIGFPVAIAGAFVLTLAVRATVGLPAAYSGERPSTAFVYQPDAFAVVVALLAGVAGVVSLTSAKAAALVGVAVSVTTVPAAADVGVAAAAGRWDECAGAAVQLGLNLVALVAAGTLTLALRSRPARRG